MSDAQDSSKTAHENTSPQEVMFFEIPALNSDFVLFFFRLIGFATSLGTYFGTFYISRKKNKKPSKTSKMKFIRLFIGLSWFRLGCLKVFSWCFVFCQVYVALSMEVVGTSRYMPYVACFTSHIGNIC